MEVKELCPGHGTGQGIIFSSSGFSLIELLMVLAVVAILLTAVLPDMRHLVAQERTAASVNELRTSLALARSSAITRQTFIHTCSSEDGQTCTRSEHWQMGWIVFEDRNHNKQRDAGENLLHVVGPLGNSTQITLRGSFGIRHYLKYKPDGSAFPNGSFLICHPDSGVGKALVIIHSGRVRLSRRQTSGALVTCN